MTTAPAVTSDTNNAGNAGNTYEEHANEFIRRHGITFSATFAGSMKHFDDDEHVRDVYDVQFTREGRKAMVIRYGQALARSSYFIGAIIAEFHWPGSSKVALAREPARRLRKESKANIHANYFVNSQMKKALARMGYVVAAPTPYDVLTGIVKYSPGSFAEWCVEYGYDTDSRKAHDAWTRCHDEWAKVQGFFTESEIEELQEIS